MPVAMPRSGNWRPLIRSAVISKQRCDKFRQRFAFAGTGAAQ
jgi:hypothetical protein